MHIWRLAERARIASGPGPEITDDAVLARKYFEEAVRLDPGDARYLGFYASLLMAEGTIHKDDKLVAAGLLHDARGGRGVAGVQLLHRRLQRQRAAVRLRRDSRKASRRSG